MLGAEVRKVTQEENNRNSGVTLWQQLVTKTVSLLAFSSKRLFSLLPLHNLLRSPGRGELCARDRTN